MDSRLRGNDGGGGGPGGVTDWFRCHGGAPCRGMDSLEPATPPWEIDGHFTIEERCEIASLRPRAVRSGRSLHVDRSDDLSGVEAQWWVKRVQTQVWMSSGHWTGSRLSRQRATKCSGAGWSPEQVGRLKLEAGRTSFHTRASIGSSMVGAYKDVGDATCLAKSNAAGAVGGGSPDPSSLSADHSSNGPKKPMTGLLAIGRLT